MIPVTEIAFTSYPVADMSRARAFYEGHFGLTPSTSMDTPDGSSFTEYEIAGGAFNLARMDGWTANANGPCAAFEVADFDAIVAELQTAGVKFLMPAFETPVCRMAIILDPDGNKLTIHKRKPGHG